MIISLIPYYRVWGIGFGFTTHAITKKQIINFVALSINAGNSEVDLPDRRSKFVDVGFAASPAFKVPSAALSFIERMELNAEPILESIAPCYPKVNEESRHA